MRHARHFGPPVPELRQVLPTDRAGDGRVLQPAQRGQEALPEQRRFAWIKAGKYTEDEFSDWSRQAREKRTECEDEKITLEEFKGWLKKT